MTKTFTLYNIIRDLGATSPSKAMTAVDIAKMADIDTSIASTLLSQMATTKRGVLARELVEVEPHMPRRYRYWVTGPYQGRGAKAAKAAKAQTVRPAASGAGVYQVHITNGGSWESRATINADQFSRVMNALLS